MQTAASMFVASGCVAPPFVLKREKRFWRFKMPVIRPAPVSPALSA
jgi:hypothetical protein